MLSLIWKEWHEQAWKLAFCSIVLGALAAIGLHARIVSDATMVRLVCTMGLVALPILAAAGLVPSERDEGTLAILLALPVQPRLMLGIKFLGGILLCDGPLILAGIISIIMAGGREMTSGMMAGTYGRFILTTIALFFWMFALTIRSANETRASLLAIGVLVFWALATVGLFSPIFYWLVPISPFGTIYLGRQYILPNRFGPAPTYIDKIGALHDLGDIGWFWLAIGVQVVVAVALWLWASRQLTRQTQEES